jgi:citrate lyase beta subunit
MKEAINEGAKVTLESNIGRWMKDYLEREKPEFKEDERRVEEDFEKQDAAWMRHIISRAKNRFLQAINLEANDIAEVKSNRMERMRWMASRYLITAMGQSCSAAWRQGG